MSHECGGALFEHHASGVPRMKSSEQLRAEVAAIRERLDHGPGNSLRRLPGVVHVSVGLKERGGLVLVDQMCIRVYVVHKRSPSELQAAELIPSEIDGIPTDVNVVGDFEFQSDNARYRPIMGGIQVSNRIIALNEDGTRTQISRGTLGCLAIDKTDNAPVVLGNWHVLYANGARDGERLYQPAPARLPAVDPIDLPVRPTDDTDKIGRLRRSAVSAKVDAAIASVDVSSCCHCCGIRYTNEVRGIRDTVANRPPRETIVGDMRAVSGMTVFKSGQATLRSEGVIVDDNYPSFSISRNGTTYSFTGQIAVQAVDHSQPFSSHGDSGAILVSLENKIVGLVFAGGRNVSIGGVDQPFISLANHIGDVFAALDIRIQYSADVVTTSGARLLDVPVEGEGQIPAAYRSFRDRLMGHEATARLLVIGKRHSAEIVRLVNHCRPVTVAWHRNNGPAWLAELAGAVREGHRQIPDSIKGVRLHSTLTRMRVVLMESGSAELRADLARAEATVILDAAATSIDLDEMVDRVARGISSTSLSKG